MARCTAAGVPAPARGLSQPWRGAPPCASHGTPGTSPCAHRPLPAAGCGGALPWPVAEGTMRAVHRGVVLVAGAGALAIAAPARADQQPGGARLGIQGAVGTDVSLGVGLGAGVNMAFPMSGASYAL